MGWAGADFLCELASWREGPTNSKSAVQIRLELNYLVPTHVMFWHLHIIARSPLNKAALITSSQTTLQRNQTNTNKPTSRNVSLLFYRHLSERKRGDVYAGTGNQVKGGGKKGSSTYEEPRAGRQMSLIESPSLPWVTKYAQPLIFTVRWFMNHDKTEGTDLEQMPI